MSKKPTAGFVGRVEQLELQHIIQLACLAGTHATINVWRANQKGYIYVRNGQLLHAVVGAFVGQDAVNEMVSWRVGRFDLKHGISHSVPRTLTGSSTNVILEATRILDERIAEAEPGDSCSRDGSDAANSLHISKGGAAELLALITNHRRRKEWRLRFLKIVQITLAVLVLGSALYIWHREKQALGLLLRRLEQQPVARVNFGRPITIPAGRFYYQDGQTAALPEFDIDVAEVTISEYAEFLAAVGDSHEYDHPDQPSAKIHTNPKWEALYRAALEQGEFEGVNVNINFPAVFVDWFDAYAYAKWRGRRLPSEQEWEKAARGNNGQRYPWGSDDRADAANIYRGDPRQKWVLPGAYPQDKSPYGVLDMGGNVSEWTSSVDRSGNPVIRGGNFGNMSADVTRRVTNQGSLTLSDRIGFRTVSDR
jgi:Sulfatase-modifying factor enzyme 1/Domain of unknown function (DUF4388)